MTRFGIGNLGYIIGIGIAFVSAPASLALSALVTVYYIFEQTPVRTERGRRSRSRSGRP